MYGKNALVQCSRVAQRAALLTLFLWLLPVFATGEVYQWTDDRGVIHFTDNLQSVPAGVRGSSDLIIRTDIKNDYSETPAAPLSITEDAAPEPKAPQAAIHSEAKQATVIPPVVHINPQYFNIVVNNTKVHRHLDKKKRCLLPEGCQPTLQPRINDRRYIHPSVFNGGSRQYIRPELFPGR